MKVILSYSIKDYLSRKKSNILSIFLQWQSVPNTLFLKENVYLMEGKSIFLIVQRLEVAL